MILGHTLNEIPNQSHSILTRTMFNLMTYDKITIIRGPLGAVEP